MIDLHTHILPGMDDGSPDEACSVEMLRRQKAQGVQAVCGTSHYYRRQNSIDAFCERRAAAVAGAICFPYVFYLGKCLCRWSDRRGGGEGRAFLPPAHALPRVRLLRVYGVHDQRRERGDLFRTVVFQPAHGYIE